MARKIGAGMVTSKTALGTFVRNRRLELGLRQRDLANLASIYLRYISEIERGLRIYLTYAQLTRLATVIGCPIQDLQALVLGEKTLCPRTELGLLIYERRTALKMSRKRFASRMKAGMGW